MKQQEVERSDEKKRKRGEEQEDITHKPTTKKSLTNESAGEKKPFQQQEGHTRFPTHLAPTASSSTQEMVEDDVEETTQYNEDNISTILLTDNTSSVSKNKTNSVNLNPVQYESWSKVQVCSLLCTPKEKGGAGLTIEKVKPFYDAGFDGNSLANIVSDIKKQDPVDEVCKDFPTVPRASIKNVVNWVDNLLKTRLYHLWTEEQVREQLALPISDGGVALSEEEFASFKDLHKEMIQMALKGQLEETNLKIKDFMSKKQIREIDLIEFGRYPSFFSIEDKIKLLQADKILFGLIDRDAKTKNPLTTEQKNWYLLLADFAIDGDLNKQINKPVEEKIRYETIITSLMNDALRLVAKSSTQLENYKNILKDLKSKLEKEKEKTSANVFMKEELVSIDKFTQDSSLVNDVKVPTNIYDDSIAKDLLPFIPEYQIDLFEERELLHTHFQKGATIVIVGPSGLGKTALIARRLGVNPGLFITCTATDIKNLTRKGADPAAYSLYSKFRACNNIELYATCRQLVQLNFISRLVSAHHCLDIWETTEDRTPFKSPLQMLAYSQWNGNTQNAKTIFEVLVEEWKYMKIEDLRKFTLFLVDLYYERLDMTNKSAPFIIGIDEASIFSTCKTPLMSSHGTPRDLLTVITSEIQALRLEGLNISDVYCGTMFTVDIVDIIQSSIGKSNDIVRNVEMVMGLDLISFENALEMLGQIFNVENILKKQGISQDELKLKISHLFPTRRRVLGLVLEQPKMILENIEKAFKDCWNTFVSEVTVKVFQRLDKKTSKDRMDKDVLITAVTQYDFPKLLGKTFKCNQPTASSLIASGLARPICLFKNDLHFEFDVTDPIFIEVAKNVLNLRYEKNMIEPLKVLNVLLSIPHHHPDVWKIVCFLVLSCFSGKAIGEIQPLNLAINNTRSIEETIVKNKNKVTPVWKDWSSLLEKKFDITSTITCNQFYRKYRNTEWAKLALENAAKDTNLNGDCLYFYCLEHHDELGELIHGLYYQPSEACHPDGICFNITPELLCIVTSNKLQNCKRDNFTNEMNEGKKSIDPSQFYRYKTKNFVAVPFWNDIVKQIFTDLEEKNRLIPLLAHIHVNYDKAFKSKQQYSASGKYLLLGPKMLGEFLPADCFEKLKKNLFFSATNTIFDD